jgi:hypothetical protein
MTSTHPLPPICTLLDAALDSLLAFFCQNPWIGRERELVSLFAFGHLLPQVHPDSVMFDPRQIAIECGVLQTLFAPGNPRDKKPNKKYVCKDVVIWPRPGMTCWSDSLEAIHVPLAIVEWKRLGFGKPVAATSDISHDAHDVAWLSSYTARFPECIGYSVTLARTLNGERLAVRRYRSGQAIAP